jgi:2,4-dienoyl-CoA reductase (NADPH2)
MDQADIDRVVAAFAAGARRAKEAGFDAVELHGGTGYLLTQFLSARTNLRHDGYGGELAGRMRFPLEVFAAVRAAVGDGFPVGYRFLADEYVPGGLTLDETRPFARELARAGATYLSVMVGCYDAFALPKYVEDNRREGFMAPFAAAIKHALPTMPIIAAGRIQRPETARTILSDGVADMVGLGRIVFADPLWPKKARGQIAEPITICTPTCDLCNKRIIAQRPAYCARWPEERRECFLQRVGG